MSLSNRLGLLGRKVGMMRIFTDDGDAVPVTVIDVSNNRVTQVKTVATDGYAGVQHGLDESELSISPYDGEDPQARELRRQKRQFVYGVLRTKKALLARLGAQAPRGLPADTRVVAHLLVATYQILLLDRVPAHAAVDAAVAGINSVGLKPDTGA